jgi:hypothetical protein
MKYAIIAVIIGFALLALSVEAAGRLIRGEDFARVNTGKDNIVVSKVIDGATTCYITYTGNFSAHSISCVK